MILEQVNGPEELRALPPEDLRILTQEIRAFLTEKISHTGGHLVSNLDVVELTIVLFKTSDLPEDKVIWNVGRQSCTHKVLSECMVEFDELRQYGSLGEFLKRKESLYGSFGTGHGSTSISIGLSITLGRDIRGEDYRVVSVIGDGTLTGDTAYEVLNNVARVKKNFIVALNDNKMSTPENVGGMSRYLNNLRTSSGYSDLKRSVADALDRIPVVGTTMANKTKRTKNNIKQLFIPGMPSENMGITCLDPVDGHNIQALCKVLEEAQKLDRVVLIHVTIRKGKGCRPAGRDPSYFHGVGSFDMKTGESLSAQANPSYTDVFSRKLCQLEEEHPELVVATAAMPDGTGLTVLRKRFPDQFFDVRIAEVHAAASATGMAATGLRPAVAAYSSFLRRAYDQVLHDVCIQNLPALFAIDRIGLVGSDGETHQGILDYSFPTSIPSMSVMAPKNLWELRTILDFAVDYGSPLAMHYPRGETYRGLKGFGQSISYGMEEILYKEEDTALLVMGNVVNTREHMWQKLRAEGYRCSSASGRLVKPFGRKVVSRLAERHRLIVTMEENVPQGGYGLAITAFVRENYPEVKVLNIATPDTYVEYGNMSILRGGLGIDSDPVIGTMKAGGYIGQETLEIHPTPDRKEAWVQVAKR